MKSKAVKIAFLVPHAGRSGAEITLEQLLRGLPLNIFKIYLIAPEKQTLINVTEEIEGQAHVHKFPEFRSTSVELGEKRLINPLATFYNLILLMILAIQLNRWLRKNDIQILYTISTFGHLTGALACIPTRCRLVWHVHEILSKQFLGGWGRVVFGFIAHRFVDQIITPSQAVAASILYAKNIVVIPSAVDIKKYAEIQDSTLRQELNIDPDIPLIGIIGRLTAWKGQRLFIEAVAQLCRKGLKGYFVIVGDTIFGKRDYRAELQELSRKLSVDNHISFLGFRKDVPNIVKGLDVIVVPSLRPEPFGLVAVEAMATGKPVIGSNAGGLPDIVVHEQTGLLFTMGDVAELVQAIEKLILSPQLRAQYGQAGFERAKQKYTVERYVTQSIDLLSQMAKQSDPNTN